MSQSIHAELLKRLLPPTSYDSQGEILSAELEAEGLAFDAVAERARVALLAITPNAGELLEDWERVYGLPCDCLAAATLSRSQRLSLLIAKINEGGTFTVAKAIEIAATIGYTITITENRIREYSGGYGLPYAGWEWNFVWDVTTTNNAITNRQYGDDYGFGYREWGNELLECIIRTKAQSDTLVRFIYL